MVKYALKETTNRKLTDETFLEILEGIKEGRKVSEVCNAIGTDYKTFYEMLNASKYKAAYKAAQCIALENMSNELLHLADKLELDDPKKVAAEFKIKSWILTKLKSDEYGDKVTVQHDVLNLTNAITKALKRVENESGCDSAKTIEAESAVITGEYDNAQTHSESDKDIDPFS